MTPERWEFTGRYAAEVFAPEDEHMAGLHKRAAEAGLPSIEITPDVGQLLMILASMTQGRLGLELGTLGGYSAIWIARGLAPEGRLITVEAEDRHADFAEGEIAAAGLSDRIEVVRGAALDVLPRLAEELGSGSVDFVFIDAIKTEYVEYFEAVRPLIAVGGLVTADNVYASGDSWINEGSGTDDFNRRVASDPDFEAVAIPMRQGVLIARRTR